MLSDSQNMAWCCIYMTVCKLQFIKIVMDKQVGYFQNWLSSWRQGWSEKLEVIANIIGTEVMQRYIEGLTVKGKMNFHLGET